MKNKYYRQSLILTGFFFLFFSLQKVVLSGQSIVSPGRPAFLGVLTSIVEQGLSIDSILPESTLKHSEIRQKDILLEVNNRTVKSPADLRTALAGLRAGQVIPFKVQRQSKIKSIALPLAGLPQITLKGSKVEYGWVAYKDGGLRSITYLPESGKGPFPFVYLIPGYNCGSIENFYRNYNGKFIGQLNAAGYAVYTIEKSGIGESFGCAPCEEVDLQTDINTFALGYDAMKNRPDADPNKLFIFGHSMGGVIAPIVAEHEKPAGVIAFATVFRPWSEFLPEMHRVQAPMEGKSFVETEHYVRQMHKIYYEFFINKKSPQDIVNMPELAVTATKELEYAPGKTNMWGRHWKFWQQLDSIDLANSWSNVECPVLSIFGGADYIACSELEHQLITNTVNAAHPGNGLHITIPDIDHVMIRHQDRAGSFQAINSGTIDYKNYHEGFGQTIIKWMDEASGI